MGVTASKLRQNIYRYLDEILETGIPLEIDRKGKKLRIVPLEKGQKLKNLKRHKCIKGDPEDIVHLDWSDEWRM